MTILLYNIILYYTIMTIVSYKIIKLCPATYKALKTGAYELEENFHGSRYFRHHMSMTRWYKSEDDRKSYIYIFPDNGIKLLNAKSVYLHSGPLPYLLSPILGYWRIKFNKLIKQLPQQPDRPDIDFIAKGIQEASDQWIIEKLVELHKQLKS